MMRERSKRKERIRGPGRGIWAFAQGLSLRHKLLAVILGTCVSSLLLVGIVFGAWEWTALRHAMIQDLSAHAEVVADNCKAAITFHDPADASACLRTIGVIPSIAVACVYTNDGELFAAYRRKGTTVVLPRPEGRRAGHTFGRGALTLTKPVLLDGEQIGAVCLRADLDPMYQRLQRSLIVIVGVVLLSLLAAYLISSRLQGLISGPILRLAAVARRVSEQKDYTVRAEGVFDPKKDRDNPLGLPSEEGQARGPAPTDLPAVPVGRDEVGLLIQAFNEMLEQIQQRDAALVENNEQLEVRVRERTAALTTTNERLTAEIAAHRQTDRALAEANEQLGQTVHSLRCSNKELQDFAYVAAHDLKAPLRGIGTLADWIASDYADKFDEPGRQQLRLLKGRVTRLAELINGILHYSEIGRVATRQEFVDLGRLVPETIALLDPPSHVQVAVDGTLPSVLCEKVRLGQVFHNLIDNAVKYLDKPQGRITIGCTDQGGVWRFAVTDNGPGIEAKYFEKIFQMFQTLAPRDQRESTGIGLPIVKKIVELFGGRIWVESTPGEGTTFFFTLPKHGIAAGKEDPQREASDRGTQETLVSGEMCRN